MAGSAYWLIAQLSLGAFRAMGWRVRSRGGEVLPSFGPAVIAANHIGHLDPFVLGYAVYARHRRLVRYVAVRELFSHPLYGLPLRATRQIPVDRGGDPSRAVDDAVAALAAGDLVGTFPEGTMNPTFVPGAGRTGSARMAMRADAPLIPAAVWGSQRLSTHDRQRQFPRNVLLTVDLGAPVRYTSDEDPRAVTDRLMERIRALVDQAARAYPVSPAGDHDRWWLPAHLGGTAPAPD